MSPDLLNLILETVIRLARKGRSDTRVNINGRPLDNLVDDYRLVARHQREPTGSDRVDDSSKKSMLITVCIVFE